MILFLVLLTVPLDENGSVVFELLSSWGFCCVGNMWI